MAVCTGRRRDARRLEKRRVGGSWNPKTKAPRATRNYQRSFWAEQHSKWSMAQKEQHRISIIANTNQEYVDLSAALTAINHKQYHQVAGDGTPLCYDATIHVDSRAVDCNVQTAPTNWVTRNAVKMASKAWKAQLKNAGLKARDLPRYGKRLRTTLVGESLDFTYSVSGRNIEALSPNLCLEPHDAAGADVFVDYVDTGGDTISYHDANPITRVAITDLSTGATTEQQMTLLDVGADSFNIINEYFDSRRNVETLETDNVPAATSKMMTLFSSAEEASETIVEAMDDTGDNRPYSETSTLMTWGQLATQKSPVDNTDPAQTSSSVWPSGSISFTAPCGLVKLDGFTEGMEVIIDVHAIYEM